MPKKFVGENSKAVAAKARKNAIAEQASAKKQQQLEDESWRDDDKSLAKKQQKKDDMARKKQAMLDKKAESKLLLEQELKSIQTTGKQPAAKITQAQIQMEAERRQQAAMKPKPVPVTHIEKPLEENINHIQIEGDQARTIDEAISVLSMKETSDIDRHPEKRLRSAFNAFEEERMAQLKEENPTLRLSQLKQMLRKEWLKSPDNPLNKAQSA